MNVFILSRSNFIRSPKSLQLLTDQALLLSAISVEVVRICHYTKKEPLAHQFGMILKMVAAHLQERRRIGA